MRQLLEGRDEERKEDERKGGRKGGKKKGRKEGKLKLVRTFQKVVSPASFQITSVSDCAGVPRSHPMATSSCNNKMEMLIRTR